MLSPGLWLLSLPFPLRQAHRGRRHHCGRHHAHQTGSGGARTTGRLDVASRPTKLAGYGAGAGAAGRRAAVRRLDIVYSRSTRIICTEAGRRAGGGAQLGLVRHPGINVHSAVRVPAGLVARRCARCAGAKFAIEAAAGGARRNGAGGSAAGGLKDRERTY